MFYSLLFKLEAINLERLIVLYEPQVWRFQFVMGQPPWLWLCDEAALRGGSAWQPVPRSHHGQGRRQEEKARAPRSITEPSSTWTLPLRDFTMTPLDTNTLTHGSFGTFQMQSSREAMVRTQRKPEGR